MHRITIHINILIQPRRINRSNPCSIHPSRTLIETLMTVGEIGLVLSNSDSYADDEYLLPLRARRVQFLKISIVLVCLLLLASDAALDSPGPT
jgi:hypothetical protein